ncbi:MAG TPA: SMP-30/gluconolactonase/LRE family protein [Candidatus Acidoferrales bacterium]|nr:SMP-30/gluconolactonase/LRE family protein [Candidatus Acidoferrales bacterium]
MSSVQIVADDRAGHAESPLWSPAEGALYWVDTRPGIIYRLRVSDGKRDAWPTPSRLGAIGLRDGGLIVATKEGVGFLDTASGAFEYVVDPEANQPDSRINDAKTDRAGRFWFGSMQDDGATRTGRLYRFGPNRQLDAVDEGYTIPNGFAWSPDNRTMYVCDSRAGTIFRYDFDVEEGRASNRRAFAQIGRAHGTPDGSTVDSRGYLWNARFGGGTVARYSPDGALDRVVALPTQGTTNVAFGGDDLRTLFITTGARGLTPDELDAQPLAGAVLSLRIDVPGVAEPTFKG